MTMQKWEKEKTSPKLPKHKENASHPNGFKLRKVINISLWLKIKALRRRKIRDYLGINLRFWKNAARPDVQSNT